MCKLSISAKNGHGSPLPYAGLTGTMVMVKLDSQVAPWRDANRSWITNPAGSDRIAKGTPDDHA
jgi:hypothetical protein